LWNLSSCRETYFGAMSPQQSWQSLIVEYSGDEQWNQKKLYETTYVGRPLSRVVVCSWWKRGFQILSSVPQQPNPILRYEGWYHVIMDGSDCWFRGMVGAEATPLGAQYAITCKKVVQSAVNSLFKYLREFDYEYWLIIIRRFGSSYFRNGCSLSNNILGNPTLQYIYSKFR